MSVEVVLYWLPRSVPIRGLVTRGLFYPWMLLVWPSSYHCLWHFFGIPKTYRKLVILLSHSNSCIWHDLLPIWQNQSYQRTRFPKCPGTHYMSHTQDWPQDLFSNLISVTRGLKIQCCLESFRRIPNVRCRLFRWTSSSLLKARFGSRVHPGAGLSLFQPLLTRLSSWSCSFDRCSRPWEEHLQDWGDLHWRIKMFQLQEPLT